MERKKGTTNGKEIGREGRGGGKENREGKNKEALTKRREE